MISQLLVIMDTATFGNFFFKWQLNFILANDGLSFALGVFTPYPKKGQTDGQMNRLSFFIEWKNSANNLCETEKREVTIFCFPGQTFFHFFFKKQATGIV